MNIEHEFYEAAGVYQPFEGLCLVDTFELAEEQQCALFTAENTARIEQQKKTEMFVIIGNLPYNAGQVNENDNNKNRKHETMDGRVKDTYAKDSTATNKNSLYDPYVKAIRWASDRIGKEGIVAFVTNNGFLDGVAFDGMRKHLADDFDAMYMLDLGGNVRKNPKLSGTTRSESEIFYARVDDSLSKEDKYRYLDAKEQYHRIEWKPITPDNRYAWLTEGLHAEFETFMPMGLREVKAGKGSDAIFKTYSRGVATCWDAWAYNFSRDALRENMKRMIGFYNGQVSTWERREKRNVTVDDFVDYDDRKIKWSSSLKQALKSGKTADFLQEKVRQSLYRPFTKSNLYFARLMNERVYVFPSIFPVPETETGNPVICVGAIGSHKPFHTLIARHITDLHCTGDTQCFPFYTYDEDGTHRRENITDWALDRFRSHYCDDTIDKRAIFHYTYGLLHHPEYRERYEVNLRRALPRLPYTPDFRAFARAGQRLAEIHAGYEDQPEYQLESIENPELPLDWRVNKMRLSKDKTGIRYNDFLTLGGIPPEALDYRLGNRSALEWVIDQYRVTTDTRTGIINDPNRPDDPQYIVKLVKKVITVSVETVRFVSALPRLDSALF